MEMTVLEKQIITMHEIAEQLFAMNSELGSDHNRESLDFERSFQKLANDTFDLSHGQDIIDTINDLDSKGNRTRRRSSRITSASTQT